jgi:imidazolonepropionase-like amidohydrolase
MNSITSNNIVINNINILSMVDNSIYKKKSVIINEGRITEISDGNNNSGESFQTIDGKDKYIMPGLINMHTHLGDNTADLLLYLVNGVTTIRNMWGYEGFRFRQWLFGTRVFNHLQLKKQIEERKVAGPSIYTAGPILDGDPPFFPRFLYLYAVKEKRQIEQIIKEQVNKGYDFIKIYSALSRQNFDDIIEIAKQYDIPVAGHVPDSVDVQYVLESKVQSIEHLCGFVNAYKPERNIPREDVKKLAALAAARGVWNCPTLIANERLANVDRQQEFENENQMDYISPRNKQGMRFLMKAANKLFTKKRLKGNHCYMEDFYYIIQQLKREGAGILVGTDKSVPYVVAGFSEHAEMKLLSQAGLNNYEVIQAATINAAKCLKKENEIGTIQKGKKADLIITYDNPLNNLDTIQNHLGVIKSGVYYSREKCDEILKGIKKIT